MAAVRPSSTATAARGRLPSVRRRGALHIGHSVSELFAWQPQVGQGIKVGAMTLIIRARRPARQALSRAATRYPAAVNDVATECSDFTMMPSAQSENGQFVITW